MGDPRFAFGENWQRFLERNFSPERTRLATECMSDLLELSSFEGLSVADVGCGSGIHSLAAHRLGAARILSFDLDDASVDCCTRIRDQEAGDAKWEVRTGSVLDRAFLDELGMFDVVYSWGVLHHTGAMWDAIENAARLVAPGGLFFLAIYNRADGWGVYPDGRFGPSRLWGPIKRTYCRLPRFLQSLVDSLAIAVFSLACLVRLRNPWRAAADHKRFRGMSLRVDIRDWMGGYPYEYASVDEIFRFLKPRGFVLENLRCHPGLMNNEFVFRRA